MAERQDAERPAPQREPGSMRDYDAWETNERLRHAERMLGKGRRRTRTADVVRFDPPSGPPLHNAEPTPLPEQQFASASGSPLGWLIMCGGTTGLTCGGALMIWSQVAQRPELWNFGLPMLVVGQMILCLGLGLQWTVSRGESSSNGFDPSGPTQRSNTRESPRRRN